MNTIMEFLNGKKTYIVSILTAVYAVLQAFDIVSLTTKQEQAVWMLIAAVFGITIRAAIKKAE